MRKKKFKFLVNLIVEELSSVSLLNGVFFCKTRLTSGGDFSELTSRQNIVLNCVTWDSSHDFTCKLSASATSGILETCVCRVSVRKEVKGGKSHDKVGYVDINLAEYAGSGLVTRHYILQPYHDGKKNRQDNCILKIAASMTLTCGDPVYKPQVNRNDFLMVGVGEQKLSASSDTYLNSGNFSSSRSICEESEIKRAQSDSLSVILSDSPGHRQHKRNISNGSNVFHSRNPSMEIRTSGITNQSFSHSRQSSSTTADSACADLGSCNLQSPIQINKRASHRRINETRQNANDVINQLVSGTDFTDASNTDEGIELSMFVEDGVSTMSKIESRRHRDRGTHPFPADVSDRFKTL